MSDPFDAPRDVAIPAGEPTPAELAAAAGGNENLLALWSEAEDGSLVETPFALLAAISPPAFFARWGAFREAVLVGLGLMAVVTALAVAGRLAGIDAMFVQLVALGVQGSIGLWAHVWLYGAVRRKILAARASMSTPEAVIGHLEAGSGPHELLTFLGFVLNLAAWIGVMAGVSVLYGVLGVS